MGEGSGARKKKARLRIIKLGASKFVALVKALAKRHRNREAIDENDPAEYAIKKRRLHNAVRARDRTVRVLRGFFWEDGRLAATVGFLKKPSVLIRTPRSSL